MYLKLGSDDGDSIGDEIIAEVLPVQAELLLKIMKVFTTTEVREVNFVANHSDYLYCTELHIKVDVKNETK